MTYDEDGPDHRGDDICGCSRRVAAQAKLAGREQNATIGRRQRQIIHDFIVRYSHEHGWAPSMSEIADGVGLSSRSTVHAHLHQLQAEGRLVLGGGPRMIRVTNGHIALNEPTRR